MRRMTPKSMSLPRAGAVEPARAPAPPPLEVVGAELLRALRAWCAECEAGEAAIALRDTDALEQALAARESLRPRIQDLTGRLRSGGEVPEGILEAIAGLGGEAAARDAALVERMEAERVRLRRDIDSLQRGNAPVAAYRRPDAPNPHRLDILR
jgi:hypothetical protein